MTNMTLPFSRSNLDPRLTARAPWVPGAGLVDSFMSGREDGPKDLASSMKILGPPPSAPICTAGF
jgi:hypothetical protein